jgi:uncharacterized membrane protein YfcA
MKNFFATLINGTAALYFVVKGMAILSIALVMAVAAIAGGFIGAKTAQRLSPRLLRGAVVVFGVIVAVHLMVKG